MFKLMSVIFALGAATTTTRAPVVAEADMAKDNDQAIFIMNLEKYRINHIVEKEASKAVSVGGCFF